MKTGFWLAAVLAAGMAVGVAFSGCENAKGLNGLQVSPASATLSGSNRTVAISVLIQSDLALPFQWSLSNVALGSILGSGSNAVYAAAADASGVNPVVGTQIVTVKDQYGNDGTCTIIQL